MIFSYLNDRTQQIKINEIFIEKSHIVLQGTWWATRFICGPLLFYEFEKSILLVTRTRQGQN